MARSFVTTLVEKCVNDVAHLNFQKFPLGYSFWLDNIFHFSEIPGWCLPKIIYLYSDKFGSRYFPSLVWMTVILNETGSSLVAWWLYWKSLHRILVGLGGNPAAEKFSNTHHHSLFC